MEPAGEGFVEEPLGLTFRQHAEQRIDACFDGTLAQQIGTKPVNGADVRFLEVLHGLVQSRGNFASRRLLSFRFEALPQAQLQLTCGLLCERDRDDFTYVRASLGEHAHNAIH